MSGPQNEQALPGTLRGRHLTQERKSRGEQRLSDWINSEAVEVLETLVARYRKLVDEKASRGKVLEILIKGGTIPEEK